MVEARSGRAKAKRLPWIPERGHGRAAQPMRCPTCHAPVLRGLDRDIGGMVVDCDPPAISKLGEVLALMSGRRTYGLRYTGIRFELDRRGYFEIKAGRIGAFDIVANHICGAEPLPTAPSRIVVNRPVRPDCEDPPY